MLDLPKYIVYLLGTFITFFNFCNSQNVVVCCVENGLPVSVILVIQLIRNM
jgi:hypothetical protein